MLDTSGSAEHLSSTDSGGTGSVQQRDFCRESGTNTPTKLEAFG